MQLTAQIRVGCVVVSLFTDGCCVVMYNSMCTVPSYKTHTKMNGSIWLMLFHASQCKKLYYCHASMQANYHHFLHIHTIPQ